MLSLFCSCLNTILLLKLSVTAGFEIDWHLLTYWLEDGMSILNDDKLRFTTMQYITYQLENNEMEVSNLLNDAIVQI